MKKLRLLPLALFLILSGSFHFISGGTMALTFEENRGQAPSEALFLARGLGYNMAFTREGAALALRRGGRAVSVRTRLVEANAEPEIRGEQLQAAKVHYLRGGTSLTDIPTYSRVRYKSVYPGIDLVYYGNPNQLEYDFVVAPGADPSRIALQFDGIDNSSIDAEGNLLLHVQGSEIIQRRPKVYQRRRNGCQEVPGSYHLLSTNTVAFELGPYDRTTTLVIDPILSYSTFFGGSNGNDDAHAVTTDSSGNLYVAGSTTSTNFQTAFPLQPNSGTLDPLSGTTDAFVMKLNPAGTALIFSTYIGGYGDDEANGVAVDFLGNVTVAGSTKSTDFPTTEGAPSRTCTLGPSGCLDSFVMRLNGNGSGIVFSTYLGGSGDDEARGVAVDSVTNAYVLGRTDSPDFFTTAGAYSTDPSAGGFVTKLSPAGGIMYSTYFDTIFGPVDPKGIAADSAGNTYITGSISIPGSVTASDVFLTKLNAGGTGIVYVQTIRAAKDEVGNAVAVDAAGNAYVAGQTNSINFPTTVSAIQPSYGGGPAFRTADSGSNWTVIRSGINRSSLYALAVAPDASSTIYAGADDESTGGLFRSTNGGDTWTSISTGILDPRIHAVAVDPVTPATVYAGTRTLGVYKSTNSGSSWSPTPLNNIFVTALAIDPSAPAIVYAGTDANGVYKTTNGGASWSAISAGVITGSVHAIVIDPSASSNIYVATSAGIYKSANGGAIWTASSSGLLDSNVNALVIDPRNPGVLLAGTSSTGVFRSSNAGALWSAANSGLPGSGPGPTVSALTIDATSGTFYAASGESNAMRVYRSSNGITWTATNLAAPLVTALAADRNKGGTIYSATVGGSDAFVAKWNASGSLVYATYLGGYRDDAAYAIAADSSGGVYVAGVTSSANFPIVNPVQGSFGGGPDTSTDAFAAKLSTTGSELVFSTYLGGSGNDVARGIAIDSSNTAYVVGSTTSADFPTTNALNPTRLGLMDAFIVKIGEGSAISYAVPIRGGFSAATQGKGSSISVGYGRIQQTSGGPLPSGFAIFGFRQNNVLVSEAAVPATAPITSGRIYAEVGGAVNTGIAIANPNNSTVTVTYYFTDRNGQNSNEGSLIIVPNGQVSAFLNEAPFTGGSSIFGTLTFTATQPVAVIALRGLTNERGEFLITTLPVSDISLPAGTTQVVLPHYADGGGWVTQILLVNTTDALMTGTVQFPGLLEQEYSIPVRSAAKIVTPGTAPSTLSGLVRLTPANGTRTPTGVSVFSFRRNGITVTEAGMPTLRPSSSFRLYAESSGTAGQTGWTQTGIALANSGTDSATVTFELTTITGVTTGLRGTMVLPGNGQIAMFLDQLPGFAFLPSPFQGVLRVSASTPISVIGLRGRYNERGDFLITTTPPADETAPIVGTDLFFPHFPDGGGYTTQFILFNGAGDQPASGLIRFSNQTGQAFAVDAR
jgi:hypothetical protein